MVEAKKMFTISELWHFISTTTTKTTMNETTCKFMMLIVANDVFYNKMCEINRTRVCARAHAIIFAFDDDFQWQHNFVRHLIGIGFHRVFLCVHVHTIHLCHIYRCRTGFSSLFMQLRIVWKIKFSNSFSGKMNPKNVSSDATISAYAMKFERKIHFPSKWHQLTANAILFT